MLNWRSDLSDTLAAVTQMTATEASRNFSDLLNRVAAGQEIEITRAGATVAVIGPPPRRMFLSPDDFGQLLASLPRVDEEFLRAIEEVRAEIEPPEDPWDS